MILHKLQNGIFKKDDSYGHVYKIAWVENISAHSCRINDENLKLVELTDMEFGKYKLQKGDILITRSSHLGKDGVGVMNVIDSLSEGIIFESHLIRLVPDRKLVNPYYLISFFRLPHIRSMVEQCAKRGTMTTISQPDLLELEVVLPPIDLQNKYQLIVNNIEQLISSQNILSKEIRSLKNSLNSKFFQS